MLYQEPLTQTYETMGAEELDHRIQAARRDLGETLVILGHHYQQDDVIRYADFTGDSLKLARLAAQQDAEFIVFCGVHFMAESADILTGGERNVILPDLSAGCSMADMADAADVQACLEELRGMAPGRRIVPITYVNSTAAVKAVTGRNGGACCTSGNCQAVLDWALRSEADGGAGADMILAVPDQHLVRATAVDMGYSLDACALYRPEEPAGGLTQADLQGVTFALWEGYCSVHQGFTVEQIEQRRGEYPGLTVIVHPECDIAVVEAADMHGSTETIIRTIEAAPPGSAWAVGTEINLVGRLAQQHPDKTIVNLSGFACLCSTMYRIDPRHLCWALEQLAAGNMVNRIQVPDDVRADALTALDRMVTIG